MPLLTGLIVGVLMCIPIGPINLLVVNTLLTRGQGPAAAIVLGSCLMDFTYFVTLSSGISLLPINEATALLLKAAGVILLLAFGIREVLTKPPALVMAGEPALPERRSLWGFFLFGVLIYASNPTLVATMTALTAMIRSWQLFTPGLANHVLLGAGAAVGSAVWFFTLMWGVRSYEHRLQQSVLHWANRVCGILIVITGLWMGFQIFQRLNLLS